MTAREAIKRIGCMFKVKDCHSVCLFCEYFDMCYEEIKAEEVKEENEHEKCSEK